MKRMRTLLFIIVFMGFALIAYQIMAVGIYVNELPFKGTYEVSCVYHTACLNPPTAGWGLDFINNAGDTFGDVVYASGRGTVTVSTDHTNWGKTVVISHPDLFRSRYAHLESHFASVNQEMREGSPIGYMGSTGDATGDHLHWQVYYNTDTGQGIEPIPIDGYTTSFCEDCDYTNNSFVTDMRLVDDTDSRFSLSGSALCFRNVTNGYHQSGLGQRVTYFRYCNGTTNPPTGTGTWTPVLPSSGNYHIYVFIPAHAGLILTGYAYYKVYSNHTLIETITVNQHAYANKWVRLGMFNLSTSGSYVRLTNQTGDAGRAAFDAVMFVKDF